MAAATQAVWQVQEAKSRLSELVDRAISQGPQVITRHGRPVVKVVAVTGEAPHAPNGDDGFVDFLLGMPKWPASPPRAPRRNRVRSPFDHVE